MTPAEALASIVGDWTLDLDSLTSVSGVQFEAGSPITLHIKANGDFVASGTDVLSRIDHPPVPAFEMRASMKVTGSISVVNLPGEGVSAAFGVALNDLKVAEKQFSFTGIGQLFGIGGLINPLIDRMIAGLPARGVVTRGSDGDQDVMLYADPAHAFEQRFVRPGASGHLSSIRFLDQGAMRAPQPGFDQPGGSVRYRYPGDPIKGPHWTADVNHAASMRHSDTVVVEAGVTISPAGKLFRLIGVAKDQPWLSFESGDVTAMGEPQMVLVQARAALPASLTVHRSDIRWMVRDAVSGSVKDLGLSGPHRIYTTLDKPVANNSCGNANGMTEIRMALATDLARMVAPSLDIHTIAKRVQYEMNHFKNMAAASGHHFPIGLSHPSTLSNGRAQQPDHTWGLLDTDNTEHGNCGEASIMMEQILGLLGIPARQCHVYASSRKDILQQGRNCLTTIDGQSTKGVGAETRFCDFHKLDEALSMVFHPTDPERPGVNDGEGCLELEGRLYAGLADYDVGPANGRPATYEMLLRLEAGVNSKTKASGLPPLCKFQTWAFQAKTPAGKIYHDLCGRRPTDPPLPPGEVPGVDVPI